MKEKHLKNGIAHTFADDVLPFNDAFVWEWEDFVVVVSVGTVVVVVPDEFVIWSAGNDSGTVCSVDLIVVDIVDRIFCFYFFNKFLCAKCL